MVKLWVFAVVACLLLCECLCTSAHVIGIDFGSEFLKVAGPHADNTIDIVLNELSRRKTDNYVGFRHGERYIGEQARTLAARFPQLTVAAINQLVGVTAGSALAAEIERLQYEFTTHFSNRSAIVAPIGVPDAPMTAEELYSIVLTYVKKISVLDGVPEPQNFVVTIPFKTTPAERKAIQDAAALADFHPLGYMHSTTAAAFYYGMRRRGFGNTSVSVFIIDVGSTHTEAGVYTFAPTLGKKTMSNTFGSIKTHAVVEDRQLGGRHLDLCVAAAMEREAVQKLGIEPFLGSADPKYHKAHFSLLRAAQKVRETLSANSAIPYTVEGIAPDRDFSSTFSRDAFERECAPILSRVRPLLEKALTAAGVAKTKITAFELMGGAARTPMIISEVSAAIGREADRTLNMDEAAAVGAAYYGVKLSSHYNTRSFDVFERVPLSAYFTVEPPLRPGAAVRQKLFDRTAFIHDFFSLTLNRTEDFSLLFYTSPDADEPPFARLTVGGVHEKLEKLHFFAPEVVHPNNSHLVRLQLSVNDLGLIEVSDASVSVRYAANVSTKVGDKDGEKKTEYSIRMRHRTLNVRSSWEFLTIPEFSEDELLASRNKLRAQDEHEATMRRRAEAKNALEGYLFHVKGEGLLENPALADRLPAEKRARLAAMVQEAADWLDYGDGARDDCPEEEFTKVHMNIKAFVNDTVVPAAEGEAGGESDL